MMFQRMYMMLTFFTIAFLYLNLFIVKSEYKVNKKTRILLIITSVLGFLTQYFFAIYAFLVAVVMVILFIKNKKYKEMFKYLGILVISAIIGIIAFPFSIDHMTRSDRKIGGFETTNYLDRVLTYFNMILKYFGSKWEIMLALFAIALLAILIRRKPERGVTALIIFPTILYIMLVAKLAEFLELRYVMNILPIVAIMIMLAVGSIFENKKYNVMIATVALVLLVGYGFITEKPLYLYKGYQKYVDISKEYSEDDLVYVGYTFFNHIQSLPEFMNYKKTFMIYNDQTDELIDNEELKDKNEFILSVNSSMDPERVLNETLANTGFKHYEVLYEGCQDVDQIIYKITR